MTMTLESIREQIKAGRRDEARDALEAVEVSDENRAALTFLKGYMQELDYDREGALAAYQEVLEQNPDHAEATFRAAVICDQGGDDAAAMELYERCAAGEEVPVNVLINLAVLYEERDWLEEAEACLKGVLAKYPNHFRARQFLKSVQSSYTMVYDERRQREREHHSALLDQPITDFELSVRSRNCLRQMHIRPLGDLLNTTEAELLSYKNFGETSLNEIKALLAQKALKIGQGLQPRIQTELPVADEGAGDASLHLSKSISELELSVRSRKCLQLLGVSTLGELAICSESELLNTKNFGQTSLNEIKRELEQFGLSFRA